MEAVVSAKEEFVIVMRSFLFNGTEVDARTLLMGEIVKLYPLDPTESDIALARLQRSVRARITDARLTMTTLTALTRTPLQACEVCFLVRAAAPKQRASRTRLAGGSFA